MFMSPQVSLAVGILLMVLGISFFYKSAIAGIRGSMAYWAGFLPLTIISPFLIHLPSRKNSLVKTTEGMWVHIVMAPAFFALGFFCFLAGAEYTGLPAVEATNTALSGGKAGHPLLTFNKSSGFAFPVLIRSSPSLTRIMQTHIGLDSKNELVPRNNGSLEEAIQKQ